MLAKVFIQYVLAVVFGIGVDYGYATRYGTPGDRYAGGPMACTGGDIPQNRRFCAHRWLPCGTKIVVMNLERPGISSCTVTDRGPYGVDFETGHWRGVIDLTPGAAKAVHLDGRDAVRLIYVLPPPDHPIYGNPTFLAPSGRSGPSL